MTSAHRSARARLRGKKLPGIKPRKVRREILLIVPGLLNFFLKKPLLLFFRHDVLIWKGSSAVSARTPRRALSGIPGYDRGARAAPEETGGEEERER